MDSMSLFFGEASALAAESINPAGASAHFVNLVANLLPGASEADRRVFLRDVVSRLALDAGVKVGIETRRRCAASKCWNEFSVKVVGRPRLYCSKKCRQKASRERLSQELAI